MNLVPLSLVFQPLPPGFAGTPQDFADALAARAQILTQSALSLFSVGAVAPTSDEGPFFLNGTTPYVWDVVTGAYAPMFLDPLSLRYTITQTLPADNTQYDVVYLLDPASTPVGSPLAVKVWYNGAWTSIGVDLTYLTANYYTQAQTTAAIAAATSSINAYPFKAHKSSNQPITANSGDTQITWEAEDYDPSNAFASNQYVAPIHGIYQFVMQVNALLASGSPTGISVIPKIRANGVLIAENDPIQSDNSSFRTTPLVVEVQLSQGDQVDAVIQILTTGASTWEVDASYQKTFFSAHLVQLL